MSVLNDQYQTSISANSSTSENNKINIFANILSFFKDFSIGAAATAFQRVYPKIAETFQQEQD
ncbi:3053_t:CDS:2 [Rhizophagus irregularis]|uniref:Uncharacterized protein n=1 Tax=Rhizophagus irregularis (strain DAOM 181602 / DAOM 197198 / MUCL 43194) TaxID=747089 RepID=U9TIA0_RHIID|nr:3053_t:CDS:2 [Rhizophagus irregularis]